MYFWFKSLQLKIIAMIPARLDSTRLPGKLMMDLNGSPVILSTLLNTIKTNLFDEVYVVTDSKEIYNYLIKHHKNILFQHFAF